MIPQIPEDEAEVKRGSLPKSQICQKLDSLRAGFESVCKNALKSLEKMHLSVRVRKHVKHFCCSIHLGHLSGVWRVNPRFVLTYYPRPCEIEIFMIPTTSEILSSYKNVSVYFLFPSNNLKNTTVLVIQSFWVNSLKVLLAVFKSK